MKDWDIILKGDYSVEGNNKRKKLILDCRAVSEIIGQVLMLAIVALAFSAISLAVFSDGGAINPPHTPHTNLQENIDTSENTVQIFHKGGEAIDLKFIKIILNVGGQQAEFNMSDPAVEVFDPEGNTLPSDNVFMFGDYIVIDPSSKVDITSGDAINFYFVHTESSQVIQKTVLWKEFRELPYWITPHTFFPDGTAYDNEGNSLDTELIDKIDGVNATKISISDDIETYENFTFGIDTEELGIPESTSFTKVILKIISLRHDQSQSKIIPEIYNGSEWKTFPEINFSTSDVYVNTTLDITECVKNTTELENLEVKILAEGNANDQSGKYFKVDFVGIHLEY